MKSYSIRLDHGMQVEFHPVVASPDGFDTEPGTIFLDAGCWSLDAECYIIHTIYYLLLIVTEPGTISRHHF